MSKLIYGFKLLQKDAQAYAHASSDNKNAAASQLARTLATYNHIRQLNGLAAIPFERLHCADIAVYLKTQDKLK